MSTDQDDFQRLRPIYLKGRKKGEVEWDHSTRLWQATHWQGTCRWFEDEVDAVTWIRTFDLMNPPTKKGGRL